MQRDNSSRTDEASGSTNDGKRKRVYPQGNYERDRSLCINLKCVSGVGLTSAPVFVQTFYNVSYTEKSVYCVCDECYKVAEDHYVKLREMLVKDEALVNFGASSMASNCVVLEPYEESGTEDQLPDDLIQLLKAEFTDTLSEQLSKFNIHQHVERSLDVCSEKIEKLKEEMKEMGKIWESNQKMVDEMRNEFYKPFRPVMHHEPALDMDDFDNTPPSPAIYNIPENAPTVKPSRNLLPPNMIIPPETDVLPVKEVSNIGKLRKTGPLLMPKIRIGLPVIACKHPNITSRWETGKICAIGQSSVLPPYRVRFDDMSTMKYLEKDGIASAIPSSTAYVFPMRVVAFYRSSDGTKRNGYYVGIIAEPAKSINNFRYLIFFDAGFAQYVDHDEIFPSFKPLVEVNDISLQSRDFISKYMERYPERPMVRLQVGQDLRVQVGNNWTFGKVLKTDASLVCMSHKYSPCEWIYRGSRRLKPLYDEMTRKHQGASRSFLKQHNRPYVEYSGFNTDEVSVARKSTKNNVAVEKPTHKLAPTEAVEYKTAGVVRSLHISEDRIVGREFKPHTCSNECVRWTNYPDKSDRKTPPLLYPLLVGFDRHIHRKGKKIVGIGYSTPCGRMIRNIEEMRKYLLATRCLIGLDMFSFEETINVTNQFAISPGFCKYYEEDISFGAENIGIQCINEVTPTKPDPLIYSTVRLPLEGVYINTDPAFRVCCDCVDDCNDREKCACWQLTLSAPEGINKVLGMSSYGYTNRRLKHSVITGIYECNSECTCIKKLCQNRVVQFPLSQRLQLFRTLNKGWGLRTLNDIPHGAFICIYVGQLLNEKRANEDGRKYGDEYFAELDFIETAEQTKEDYEHGVDTSGADEFFDLEKRQMDADKEFIPNGVGDVRNVGRSVNTRSQNKATTSCDTSSTQQDDDDNDSDELQVTVLSDEPEKPAPPSFRKFFGPNEDVYVMDAKKKGNIGRYLNHSCDPNTFVQNVFIDTHDPRFPWVAFFASVDIKAGTELTWDYNYVLNENGSRRLYCYCGTSMCRKYLI